MAPASAVHVPDTQMTSIRTGAVFGSEIATESTASSHRSVGTPTHEIRGGAGDPLGTGAPQPAIARIARTARRRRSVLTVAQGTDPDPVFRRIDLAAGEPGLQLSHDGVVAGGCGAPDRPDDGADPPAPS